MPDHCPKCGVEINDNTENCPGCGCGVALLFARERIKLLEGAIEGWRKTDSNLKESLEKLRATVTELMLSASATKRVDVPMVGIRDMHCRSMDDDAGSFEISLDREQWDELKKAVIGGAIPRSKP